MELRIEYEFQRDVPRRTRCLTAFHQEKAATSSPRLRPLVFRRHRSIRYCATKAAIINLTREMALDYGPLGIRMQLRLSGRHRDHRCQRISAAADLGRRHDGRAAQNHGREQQSAAAHGPARKRLLTAWLFLVSDEASFVTGHALVVDGGQTIDALSTAAME